MQAMVARVFQGESFEGMEWENVRADGSKCYVLSSMFPLRGAGNAVTGAICANVDITERKRYEEQLNVRQADLVEANNKLERLATEDGLTGLKNHRTFQERLHAELYRAQRYGNDLSLLLIDVDNFKLYNDTYGHIAGDAVLREVARMLQEAARVSDLVCRYGGEEFVVILPETDYAGSITAGERCRRIVETLKWPLRPVTISVGIATYGPEMPDEAALIAAADVALYASKRQGRNAVTHIRSVSGNPSEDRPGQRAA